MMSDRRGPVVCHLRAERREATKVIPAASSAFDGSPSQKHLSGFYPTRVNFRIAMVSGVIIKKFTLAQRLGNTLDSAM